MSDLQRRLGIVVVEHPAIHGITASGKEVTLVAAVEAGGQMNLFTEITGDTIITAPRVYVGAHFDREETARFRRLDLRLTYLDSWMPPPLIDRQTGFSRGGHLRRSVLTYVAPRPVKAKMPFGVLTFGHDFGAAGDLRRDARFTQAASIVATTDRQQPLEWWLATVVKPMRYLVSLSTELPVAVEEIHLRPWAIKQEREVEVVWTNDRPSDSRRDLNQAQMLLWYGDLASRFESVMHGWFNAVVELEDILDQFIATLNSSRSFVETRFTMTVSAAEAYHRQRIGGTDAPHGVHRERMAQARQGVDQQHLAWLNERLSNDPSLYRRLVELCRLVPEVTALMVGGDADGFAREVRDARNYRTHLDPRRRAMAPRRNLVKLQAQLAVILIAGILHRELGFRPADLAERIARASRLRQLAIAAARAR